MSEQTSNTSRAETAERLKQRTRSPYAAAPLLGVEANRPGSSDNYYQTSLDRIDQRVAKGLAKAQERGEVSDFDTLEALCRFARESLYAAQARRVNYHDIFRDKDLEGDPSAVEAALEGTATPAELVDILASNRSMQAVELCKLYHPFDREPDDELDMYGDIIDLCDSEELDGGLDQPERLKVMRLGIDDTPALIIVKKRAVCDIVKPEGNIRIIERKSVLVRCDDEALDAAPEDVADILRRTPREHLHSGGFKQRLDATKREIAEIEEKARHAQEKGIDIETRHVPRRLHAKVTSCESEIKRRKALLDEAYALVKTEIQKEPDQQNAWLQPIATSFYAYCA